MFEGLVASIFNKWLNKYVEDLDTEHLNVGIFSGEVKLHNLNLKPEALFELELPIEVKYGVIGVINLTIPWASLSNQAIVINVEDILIVSCPIGTLKYSEEREKRLIRALKRKILSDIEGENFLGGGSGSLLDDFLTVLTNNVQIFIRNIHIRYEDGLSGKDCAGGLCIESLSLETTNSKWKPCNKSTGNLMVYQLGKLEAASLYFNTEITKTDFLAENWREDLKTGLRTFSINGKTFDFVVKPFNAKMKAIISRSAEVKVPKLLVDLVIHDIVCALSRTQLQSIIAVLHLFHLIHLRREFLSFRPTLPVHGNASQWWKYSCEAVSRQRIRPYYWENIRKHRLQYREYNELYRKSVLNSGDTELRLDLCRAEDKLPLSSIIIAREQGKIEIRNEDPDRIEVIGGEEKWWNFHRSVPIKFQIRPEKPRGIWAQLSPSEKQKLADLRRPKTNPTFECAKKDIEHKLNLTIHHFSGCIFLRDTEIASGSITQFLVNFETRPVANAFKISARAENFSLEGITADSGLVPLINLAPIKVGSSPSNFLRIDFEKNPLGVEADCGVTFNLEQIQIIYHDHAFSQFSNFFQGTGVSQNFSKSNLLIFWEKFNQFKNMIETRRLRVNLNVSIKGPQFVVDEKGSFQKSGSIMILDLGNWTVFTDLQSHLCLDEVTQMELEERLYDRIHINFEGFQMLFSDSEDKLKKSLDLDDSEYHLVSKVRGQIVLSESIKPDYKLLPKSKVNFSVHNLKINLSNRRLVSLFDFFDGLPLPSLNPVAVIPTKLDSTFQCDLIKPDVELDLDRLKNLVISIELSRQRTPENSESLPLLAATEYWSAAEVSDDDVELWARTIDLPGFDDNISPHNVITSLFRIMVGEFILLLSRSNDAVCRPYIMLRISKCRFDSAIMNYGPAIQATVGGVQLIDKFHVGTSGEYLEIISTQSDLDFISLLYRKVQSDCPDFKTHFHNVERSLVLDVGVLAATVHKEAILTFTKYLQSIRRKFAHREILGSAWRYLKSFKKNFETRDPPIPPGAVKFSYSVHLSEFRLRLCDTDMEFLELKVKGFESDCMFKANERMVLRAFLAFLSLDDLSNTTHYSKIISVEEDKVLELKYVRHSPRLYNTGLGSDQSDQDDVHSDGSLKLNLEKIHFVLIYKTISQLQHFIEPLISMGIIWQVVGYARRSLSSHLIQFKGWDTRLHLFIILRLPILLVPQKSVSPNLLVFNLGELSIENFFKEITGHHSRDGTTNVIDNILLKFQSASLSRALMTLIGRLENQESILDPIHSRFDVKRFVGGPKILLKIDNESKSRKIPLFEIHGNLEPVKISLGQKDLHTIFSVWNDNLRDRKFLESSWRLKCVSPLDGRTPTENEDTLVRKLQVFLSHSDACRKDTIARFVVDSVTIDLYNDIGEAFSSPMRDFNRALCRLTLGEASLFVEKYYDGSMDVKMALQTCILEDVRANNPAFEKRVLQCRHIALSNFDEISISTPPIVDVTFKQNQTGDRCIDVLVEKMRYNLTVSFLEALAKFGMNSVPDNFGGKKDEEIIGHEYMEYAGHQVLDSFKDLRPPLSNGSTSGYYSSGISCATDEQSGLSISLQCRKPEIFIFANGRGKSSAIVFRSELMFEWSKHPGRNTMVVNVAGFQALCRSPLNLIESKHKTTVLLNHCDVEIAKKVENDEVCSALTIKVTPIDLQLSVTAVSMIAEIVKEIQVKFGEDVEKNLKPPPTSANDLEDLWSPKKITPDCIPNAGVTEIRHFITPVSRTIGNLTVIIPKIRILFDVSLENRRRPLFFINASFKLLACDRSSYINMRGELQIEAAYFNEKLGEWEPFIEPCGDLMNDRRPWELVIQVFQGKSFPISPHTNFELECSSSKDRKVSSNTEEPINSETSGDDSDNGMIFLRRQNFDKVHEVKRQNFSLSPEDSSESENENESLDKLTKNLGRLFTDGNSDEDMSESADTSATDEDEEKKADDVETEEETASSKSLTQERAIFLKKHYDSLDSGLETEAVERLATHVLLYSRDKLEISVTPSSVKVFQEISKGFSENQNLSIKEISNPVIVRNSLGPGSCVTLLSKIGKSTETRKIVAFYEQIETPPSSPESPHSNESIKTDNSDFDSIECNSEVEDFARILQYPKMSPTELYDRMCENRLLIEVPGFNELNIPAPNTNGIKTYILQPHRRQIRYHIIINTEIDRGLKRYSVNGPLRIRNCTSYAVEIYYKRSILEMLGEETIGKAINPFEDWNRLTVIEPDDVRDIPLYVAYHCKLHILPAHLSSYNISENGLSWQEMMTDLTLSKDLCCLPKQENDSTTFSLRVFSEENLAFNSERPIMNCTVQLLPPLTVQNLLPYALEIKLPGISYEARVEVGGNINIYLLNIQKPQKITVEVPDYLGIRWTGSLNLNTDVEEKVLTMVTDQETEGGNKQLFLSLLISRIPNMSIRVYSSYWIVNKTGLPLQIRSSLAESIHECTGEGPLLFGYRKQRRRCIRVRAFSSSWSSAFSLDAPGSSGLIICKDKERKRLYRILTQSHLSRMGPNLTKIISFLPNFIVTNSSRKNLRFMEDNERADLWIDLSPGQCLPFWPETNSMRMFVKFRDSRHVSQHFPLTVSHSTVLRMDKGCGITVNVTGSIGQPFMIHFEDYKSGDAPVRIDNQCEDLFLKFHQNESGQVVLLSPYQSLLYTWDDPSKERSLLWNVYNSKGKDFCVPFWKDGFGEEKVTIHVVRRNHSLPNETVASKFTAGLKRLNPISFEKKDRNVSSDSSSSCSDDSEEEDALPQLVKKTRRDKIVVYWVSYLQGRQRVLLLTQDELLGKRLRRSLEAERSHLELIVSIPGVGLSLINENQEKIPRELAYFSLSDSAAKWEVTVAHRWKSVALELASWLEDRYKQRLTKAQIKDYIQVDFDKMQMTKPFFGELRRRHRPAIWIQYRRSKHMSVFHFQIHRFQIDNQLHEAEFPMVLSPVSPPLNSSKCNSKPAAEIAYLKKYSQTGSDVYKFVKFVVQEHKIQIERFWLAEMSNFFGFWLEKENFSTKVRKDIALLHMPISGTSKKEKSDSSDETMFEYLHCSPIKLQIVFSSRVKQDFKEYYGSHFVDYLFTTLAPSFAQIRSITVKLLCFEIIGRICTKDFIWKQAVQHFRSQFCQQLHVFVMGINVLTNPYSQYLDFSDDSHPLFYEPYLEKTGVPEEFSDGISHGVLGLLGHETQSQSGTDTLFAALLGTTLQHIIQPEESKKNSRPRIIEKEYPDSVYRSFFNFSAVCLLALSGVVMEGTIGSYSFVQGVENFFKGPGKGLMSLMTKSTDDVFNCLSMIIDGVKRAMEMGENIFNRVRCPRNVNPILGLKPYCEYQARGLMLLKILCKGLYCDDTYWAHAILAPEYKVTILVTLQHIFLIRKYKSWSPYDVVWVFCLEDLTTVTLTRDEKLMLKIKQDKNSTGDWNEGKIIPSTDKQLLHWLKNQIEAAMVVNLKDKPSI